MSYILVAPLKHMVTWKRSPIVRVNETRVIINPYENHKFEKSIYSTEIIPVEPEYIHSLPQTIDIPSVVFKGCPDQLLHAKFTAENIIFEDCDESFTYYMINAKRFPNAKNIYLPSYVTHMNLLSCLLYLPKCRLDEKEMIKNVTIFIKQESNNKFACLTDLDYWYTRMTNACGPKTHESVKPISSFELEERMNKLCQTMLHPKDFINENSPLKMNSRYSSDSELVSNK